MDPTMENGDDSLQNGVGFGSFQAIEQPQREARRKGAPPEHLSADNTNRKMLNMPPVVGSMIHYSNKHLKFRPMPDDVDAVREKLFRLEKDILLNSQQIADYWPHMSSVWQRSAKATKEVNGTMLEAWECRMRRRVKEMRSSGERQRATKDELLDDVEPCKLRIRIVSYTKHVEDPKEPCGPGGFMSCKCIPEWAHLSRTIVSKNAKHEHTHSMEMADRFKRADAIMYFAKLKVEEGYSYATVVKWIKAKYGHISTQVQHLNHQDVANVSRWWRFMNKDAQLRKDIEDDTERDRRRTECLDHMGSTSQKRLVKALAEVCKRIPEAIDIAIPFLERQTDEPEQSTAIAEGDDIDVPAPGIPPRRDLKIANIFEPTTARLLPPKPLPPPPLLFPPPRPPAPRPPPPQHVFQAIPYLADPTPRGRPLQPKPTAESNGPGQHPGPVTGTHIVPKELPIGLSTPGAAGKALINTPTSSRFVAPYAAAKAFTPVQTMPSSSSTWPPLGVTQSAARPNASHAPHVNGAGAYDWRPAWATPVTKRPAADPPEASSQPRKRLLVDEITDQLQSELRSSGWPHTSVRIV